MGYEIHIKRVSPENESAPISLEEWSQYVASDASLFESAEEKGVYLWHAHPLGGIEGELPWLRYTDGQISSRHPDEFLTLKMFEIAHALHARVSDDEYVFDQDYQSELESYTQKMLERGDNRAQPEPWWKFW